MEEVLRNNTFVISRCGGMWTGILIDYSVSFGLYAFAVRRKMRVWCCDEDDGEGDMYVIIRQKTNIYSLKCAPNSQITSIIN